jgi:hypothetical protein
VSLSIRSTAPAGIMTFRPKIHGPVSTISHEPLVSFVASSTFPIDPSRASISKPARSIIPMRVRVFEV